MRNFYLYFLTENETIVSLAAAVHTYIALDATNGQSRL